MKYFKYEKFSLLKNGASFSDIFKASNYSNCTGPNNTGFESLNIVLV